MVVNTDIVVAIITGVCGIAAGYLSGGLVKRNNKNDNNKLINHYIFNRIDILNNEILNEFTLKNKGKEVIFKDILSKHLNLVKENARVLADNVDNGHIENDAHLYNTALKCINDIETSLKTYYLNDSNYTQEEKQTLNIVMEKYNKVALVDIQNVTSRIQSTCYSPFYNDLNTKCAIILDIYMNTVLVLINNAEKTLGTLNGDLKGLKFKNIIL